MAWVAIEGQLAVAAGTSAGVVAGIVAEVAGTVVGVVGITAGVASIAVEGAALVVEVGIVEVAELGVGKLEHFWVRFESVEDLRRSDRQEDLGHLMA